VIELDPKKLLRRLAGEIPKSMHRHVLVVGSLAAAWHYRTALRHRAVNTKDADLVVHPAGDVASCRRIAERLLHLGWTRTDLCHARPAATPTDELRAIRLHPPDSKDYFVELLGVPGRAQRKTLAWVPVRLADGWYGIGCLRYMALPASDRTRSAEGIDVASPASMALANLLSHPTLGTQRMSAPLGGRTLLRSAKDLGRVLGLAVLEGVEGTRRWAKDWERLLRKVFPTAWKPLARRAGDGIRALLKSALTLEEARITLDVGLLSGMRVDEDGLRAAGERLLADALEPLRLSAGR
jgi:hypothetical protein